MARLNSKWLVAGSLALGTIAVGKALRQKRAERRTASAAPLIGEVCRVRSRKANKRRGEADFNDGKGGRKIKVRSTAKMARGDMARIVAFDAARNAYLVEPVR